jgi:hypothetical protein
MLRFVNRSQLDERGCFFSKSHRAHPRY